ncbi:hypothetical protein [Lacrimispora xylanisolvens]|uniref:hypothetical protein n=1 Tax=Lacrimispora xylanisolvens TaxID=384636 RepID=UPI002402C3CC
MNKRKKNIFLVCIYAVMLLLCFLIVLFLQKVHSPHTKDGDDNKATESTAVPYTEEEPETKDNRETFSAAETEQCTKEAIRPSLPRRTEMAVEESKEEEKPYQPPVIVIASDVHYFHRS